MSKGRREESKGQGNKGGREGGREGGKGRGVQQQPVNCFP